MIVFIILLIVILGLIPISIHVFKKKFNPISIINFVFGIWFILGRIGFLGQFIPTFESSVFLELNLLLIDVFIFIGYQVVQKRRKKNKRMQINLESFFKIFRIICLAVSIAVFLNLVHNLIIGEYSIDSVRDMSYSTRYGDDAYAKIYFNSFIYYFYQYIVRGFAFFDLTYGVIRLLKKGEKISIISILNFILFVFIMQSRIEVMKLVIFVIIALFYSGLQMTKRQKKLLKRGSLLLIIVAIITFSIRSISSSGGVISNTFDSFIVDFSGSNYTFSLFFTDYNNGLTINDSSLVSKYLGGLSLAVEPIFRIFGMSVDHSAMNNFLIVGHDIGSSDHYNAFYTMYLGFLNSGGYIGCFVFSAILGLIIGITFRNKCKEITSLKKLYVASFMTYIAVMGTYNYVLSGISALVIVICILLIHDDVQNEKDQRREIILTG